MSCKYAKDAAIPFRLEFVKPDCDGGGAADLTGVTSVAVTVTKPDGTTVTSPDLSALTPEVPVTGGVVLTPAVSLDQSGVWRVNGTTAGEAAGVVRKSLTAYFTVV